MAPPGTARQVSPVPAPGCHAVAVRIPRPVVRLVARAKPAVPERAWPALLTARSLAGERPLVGLPAFRRVLVVAPHPDDESVGCGGSIRLWASAGARVVVLFATDGEGTVGASEGPAEVSARRRAEAGAACHVLGAEARHAGHPDGGLAGRAAEFGGDLSALAAEVQPEAVLVPWFGDGHPDHAACTAALAAADLRPQVEVWGYETWTPLPANRLIDITAAVDVKKAAIGAHATAHRAFDVGALVGLSRYRSVHGLMGRGYAEAFLAAPLERYLAAARRYQNLASA